MKSTMMSSPLLVDSMLERAAALFPGVAIVSMQPDGSRHGYTYRDLRRRARQARWRNSPAHAPPRSEGVGHMRGHVSM